VLVAKSRIAAAKLSEEMKREDIKKSYIAILDGTLEHNSGTIETYIRRAQKSIILREVCGECEDGKIAITNYRVLARANGLTLVEAEPQTGRTHQLRVHFSHLGAPILGDDLYGSASPLIERHALHARKLNFVHPDSRKVISIQADLPEDMREIIEKYFGKELF
jgi:23S rRNA pseudouridine1911/1915/1917 synthase